MVLDFRVYSPYIYYVFKGVFYMNRTISITTIPCPDPKCREGKIIVHNAYSSDPLVGKEQLCDRCGGQGFLVLHPEVPSTN